MKKVKLNKECVCNVKRRRRGGVTRIIGKTLTVSLAPVFVQDVKKPNYLNEVSGLTQTLV